MNQNLGPKHNIHNIKFYRVSYCSYANPEPPPVEKKYYIFVQKNENLKTHVQEFLKNQGEMPFLKRRKISITDNRLLTRYVPVRPYGRMVRISDILSFEFHFRIFFASPCVCLQLAGPFLTNKRTFLRLPVYNVDVLGQLADQLLLPHQQSQGQDPGVSLQ